ncbi:fatty acid desaturase family protein [Collimonas fungivorans]|uniref:Fatty acid desaturase family protein n=1 Tax=Collimonas fungivorans TaxID=158899 RepID=A0A127P6A1_9BURK|nr:fatty acid desaturase [Collimonas fungivorans]AMO93228.1 fatty acid desaturase family protein [Collimonas fungivorans]
MKRIERTSTEGDMSILNSDTQCSDTVGSSIASGDGLESRMGRLINGGHSLLAILYVIFYFICERLSGMVYGPALIAERLFKWSKLVYAAPTIALISASALTTYGAAHGMALAADYGPLALFAAALMWLILLAVVSFSYFTMTAQLPSLDAIQARVEKAWPQRWYARHLAKPVDAHYILIIIANSLVMWPALAALLWPGGSAVCGVVYYVIALMTISRSHEELDHNDIHNHFFNVRHMKPGAAKVVVWLTGKYLRLILNPLCSRIPHFYRVHHVYMHHVENNSINDLQTTAYLDRTSFIDFCTHSLRLAISNSFGVDLYRYLDERGAKKHTRLLLLGLGGWFLGIALIAVYSPFAAVIILLVHFLGAVPGAISTYIWHGFIDNAHCDDVYRNTINAVSPPGTAVFGSLHLRHHLKGGEHWTRQYQLSQEDKDKCERNGALLLRPMRGPLLLRALWTGSFDLIADYVVSIGAEPKDKERTSALLKERTRPLVVRPRSPAWQRLDQTLGGVVSRYVMLGAGD